MLRRLVVLVHIALAAAVVAVLYRPRPEAPSRLALAVARAGDPGLLAARRLVRESFRRSSRSLLPFVPESVRVTITRSAVVPGLRYVWGEFADVGIAPVVAQGRVAALRNGRARMLESDADWAAAAGGWLPRDSAEAWTGCLEMARALRGTFADAELRPYLGDPAVFGDAVMLPEDSLGEVRRVRERPRVERTSAGWRVRTWIVQPAVPHPGAWRMQCAFPAAAPARLRMLDSVTVILPIL